MKSRNKILLILAIAMLISTMTIATASATSDVKNEKKNTGIAIESKEKKVSSYKVTWNYNGGKIGNKKSKVTTVKKGSKIGKFVATPKRSNYAFKGWYTKKTGGKKITKNTKITKKVTFFAQWTKKSSSTSRVLNSEEKKLVGTWKDHFFSGRSSVYEFRKDGTFIRITDTKIGYMRTQSQSSGYYSLKNGLLTLQLRSKISYNSDQERFWDLKPLGKWETSKCNVKFYTEYEKSMVLDERKQYIDLDDIRYYKES